MEIYWGEATLHRNREPNKNGGNKIFRSLKLWPCCAPGLPDFYSHNIPKWEEIYQTATKITKWQ
jgi:hypothetical protein